MIRTIDMLLAQNRFISSIASLSLLLFVAALLLVGVVGVTVPEQDSDAISYLSPVIGALLWGTLALGLAAMVAASWKVLHHRHELLDWGMFLVVVWLIPYLGIAVYLGGANLLDFLKKVRNRESRASELSRKHGSGKHGSENDFPDRNPGSENNFPDR